MAETRIHFFSEDIEFHFAGKEKTRQWIRDCARAEGWRTGDLNFIFCTDSYLLRINQEYLDHDTYTDIITFDNGTERGRISGDIFISIDRIRENASKLGTDVREELDRVIIHGVLHLLGYKDKSADQRTVMRGREDHYLRSKRNNER